MHEGGPGVGERLRSKLDANMVNETLDRHSSGLWRKIVDVCRNHQFPSMYFENGDEKTHPEPLVRQVRLFLAGGTDLLNEPKEDVEKTIQTWRRILYWDKGDRENVATRKGSVSVLSGPLVPVNSVQDLHITDGYITDMAADAFVKACKYRHPHGEFPLGDQFIPIWEFSGILGVGSKQEGWKKVTKGSGRRSRLEMSMYRLTGADTQNNGYKFRWYQGRMVLERDGWENLTIDTGVGLELHVVKDNQSEKFNFKKGYKNVDLDNYLMEPTKYQTRADEFKSLCSVMAVALGIVNCKPKVGDVIG